MLRPRDEIREEDLPSDRVMEALPDALSGNASRTTSAKSRKPFRASAFARSSEIPGTEARL